MLSVEFKINMLAPAAGDRIVARGSVIRAGRTVTVCWGEVTAYTGDEREGRRHDGRDDDDRSGSRPDRLNRSRASSSARLGAVGGFDFAIDWCT